MRTVLLLLLLVVRLHSAELPAFDAAAKDWSPANALIMAEAAALAYDGSAEAKIKTVLRCESVSFLSFPLNLPKKFSFEEGEPGPQAFLAAGKDAIVLAFRGTETNFVDLLTDAWVQPVKLAAEVPGQVHSGFASTFITLLPELKTKLAAARTANPDAKLWITGHSLGGALAVMAAAQLALVEKVPVQGLVTCGCPVTGDADFHKALDAALANRSWRVVIALDPVPLDFTAIDDKIPFLSLPAPMRLFRHGGLDVWLNTDGTSFFGGTTANVKAATAFIKDWIKSREWQPADVLKRHSMGVAYLPALRKLYERTASPAQ